MIEDICEKVKCTGCAACASACPKSCIEMLQDQEGFLRPVIKEDLCVHCNLCRKICPINNKKADSDIQPLAFAARIKNKDIRARSSSGGLFSAFAGRILEQNGAVIAAGFDEKHQVVHKVCTDISGLDELRRSKYTQSKIGPVYRQARALLEAGKAVLFCGTPCQTAGIEAYLGKDYDHLYTLDFICHGVPSPLAYNRYLDYLREKYQSEISKVDFRSKSKGWRTYSLSVRFTDGNEHTEPVTQDLYLRSFITNMDLRPSCYQCAFKTPHREADITIADFWGIDNMLKEWNDDTGVSVALIHSEKGKRLFDSCLNEVEAHEIAFSDAIAQNQSMISSVEEPPLRNRFIKDLNKLRYDKLYSKYCGTSITSRIRRKLANLV